MAYLRGDYYLWHDSEQRLHIWAHDGRDDWEKSGWAVDRNGERSANRVNAAGVSIRESVMDEYVVMRMAQLIENGKVGATITRALRHGNVGGEALAARAEALVHALAGL